MRKSRVFEVNKGVMEMKGVGKGTCYVCEKKFQLKEKIVLTPIQRVESGFASVMSIILHEKCYWVKND